ncbi:coenzyme F420-0:L-glutamate ligase [Dactylosporangium roseum]|uniref:Coenzyme F420-0:L-glutamate ligase n=1 Tax=Dactylosporangium roseum TaxID=47989 RepID=A0ABY5Z337_9ACTN|nr:coenzyme F420-0:L-glutamate ligase [Dactylosporangium roseum]UWZ35887.1 coenzyme F420-0:L-glutamate ligase [Dactylosporangium roseum]
MTEGISVLPVVGIGDVRPGADLAGLIRDAAPWIADGDILVVTSKVVSKAEGQLVEIPLDEPARETAREAVLRAETARVVARRGATRIVQTHHGFVLAAAGIDASNVDPTHLVLLPKDPDASARWLRDEFRERFGLDVAVVVTDTMGRPWRLGLTDVAIGAAGINALTDYRGRRDTYGNELQLTQMAVVDELAAAADLVKGKTDQVPVAVVRGLPIRAEGHGTGAAELIRGADADLFSLGTAEAVARGLRASAEISDAAAFQPGPVTLPDLPFPQTRSVILPDNTAAAIVAWAPAGDLARAVEVGMEIQRLRAILAAEGLATVWIEAGGDPRLTAEVPEGGVPLGVLAIGRGSLPSL